MQNLKLISGFILILMAGCTGKKIKWNNEIDPHLKSRILILDKELVEGISSKDPQKVAALFSSKSKAENSKGIDSLVTAIRSIIVSGEVAKLDECYISDVASLPKPHSIFRDSIYQIFIDQENGEFYLSLMLMKCESSQLLLTCMYGREGKEWKLNSLKAGNYAYDGKNTIDFFEQAKQDYRDSNLINAINNLTMARAVSRPAGNSFVYVGEEKMKAFARKTMEETMRRFPMPYSLTTISTRPQVFSVRPFPMANGIFPSVSYVSKINLNDTIRLWKENQEIQKELLRIFPGIEKGHEYIFLQAFNEIPRGKTELKHHEFVMPGMKN